MRISVPPTTRTTERRAVSRVIRMSLSLSDSTGDRSGSQPGGGTTTDATIPAASTPPMTMRDAVTGISTWCRMSILIPTKARIRTRLGRRKRKCSRRGANAK